jgi:hypothetical protein
MRPALIFCALALAACAPPAEPRDASADRRVSRPDSAPDAEEPMFEDVFFPPVDVPSIDSGAELDATAPDSSSPTPDAWPDSAPDARDAGSDARDAAPDVVCPADGFGGLEWRLCYGQICCAVGRCRIDINDRPYCQG